MIKINLIGEDSVGSTNGVVWLAAYGGSVALLIAIFVVLQLQISWSISELESKTTETETQLARLREKTKEVRDLESKKNELQNMTLAIAALKKTQEGPVRLMDDLNLAVPDKLWLHSLETKPGGILNIDGVALTDEALVTFMRDLEKSVYFERVDLIERKTAPLVQVNTLNTFDHSQSRSVVRGEKDQVTARLNEVKREAERLGLAFEHSIPPDETTKTDQAKGADSSKLSFGSQGQSRFIGGKPTLYAWESLEQVQGESFNIDAKIRFTPKNLNIDAIQASLVAHPTPTVAVSKAKPVNPKAE